MGGGLVLPPQPSHRYVFEVMIRRLVAPEFQILGSRRLSASDRAYCKWRSALQTYETGYW